MKKLFILLFIFSALFGLAGFVSASIISGTIDSTYKYAWGDSCGWINFGTDNSNVYIGDDRLTGYAWSELYGWINLAPDGSGVKNNREGTLSGYAWGENTGWINFSGVTISSSGIFSGTASGDTTGTISFNCAGCTITTDWRPVSIRTGGPATASSSTPYPPSGELSVSINNGQAATNNPAVILTIRAGSDVKKMMLSNSPDFTGAVLEDFQSTKDWILTQGDGQKTIYVKFYNQQNMPSEVVSASINLDTQKPEITITQIKSEYSPEEEVILGGETKPNSEISLKVNGRFGLFSADSQGKWLITLGKKSLGKHTIELTAKDILGNMGKTLTVEFIVKTGVVIEGPSIIEKIGEELKKIIPPIFKPKEEEAPLSVITVPEIPPMAFSYFWNLLPVKAIKRFVLSPLPTEIKVLAQKFPELEKTFKDVGITKITDVEKIKIANLKLPGLTQTLNLAQVEIAPGKFTPPKGVPVVELPATIKQRIPSEIVFARTGGGLIDLNIALSIGSQGKPEQRIKITAGAPLQLVVKVDTPVKKIKGYIVFKSKKPKEVSSVSLDYLTASLMFAGPNLAENQTQPVNTEERLVLLEFEYEDTGDGVYIATIQTPVVDGEYEIITVLDYEDEQIVLKEIKLITVVDPEGYIYEKDGEKETRILGAIASLYWLNPDTKQYELWPSKDYQQENPQTTDVRGTYSFLVPEGYYYLKVDAPGYLSYDGKPFQVTEGRGVHINVELKTIYWWTKIVDWKIVLLIIVILMLLYNFYRDKIREKINV